MRKPLAAAAAAIALATPAAAEAHVTLQPSEVPAGGFARLDVRVPNERDEAATRRVQLKLPAGVEFASYEPVPGWRVNVARAGKDVSTITWTGARGIPAGAFQDFGLSVRLPDKAGETLTFKAVQAYGNGEVVRWIGPEGSDEPAPTVRLTAAEREGGHAAAGAATPAAASGDEDDGGGSDGLAIVALAVGALGLLAGIGALATARRTRPGAA